MVLKFRYGMFFPVLLLCAAISGYAEDTFFYRPYAASRLGPGPDTGGYEQLELLAETVTLKTLGPLVFDSERWFHAKYLVAADYVIRNTGADWSGRMGIRIRRESDSFGPDQIHFRVDGRERPLEWIMDQRLPGRSEISVDWTVISVTIPAQAEITIRVEYPNMSRADTGRNPVWPREIIDYNNSMFFGGNLSFRLGRGYTYSLTVENSYSNTLVNMENYWISDILFTARNGTLHSNIQMCYYLLNMENTETELFSIIKLSAVSWRVDFTDVFTDRYEIGISIFLSFWSGTMPWCSLEWWTEKPTMHLWAFPHDSHEAIINQRKLGPYEFLFLTDRQLRIMRNAFYAQYGYIFRSRELNDIFMYQVQEGFMYRPNPDFSESMLTDIDRANIRTIQRLEGMDRGP